MNHSDHAHVDFHETESHQRPQPLVLPQLEDTRLRGVLNAYKEPEFANELSEVPDVDCQRHVVRVPLPLGHVLR